MFPTKTSEVEGLRKIGEFHPIKRKLSKSSFIYAVRS